MGSFDEVKDTLGWGKKYPDKLMSEVPDGYFEWFMTKCDTAPKDLKDRIRKEMRRRATKGIVVLEESEREHYQSDNSQCHPDDTDDDLPF